MAETCRGCFAKLDDKVIVDAHDHATYCLVCAVSVQAQYLGHLVVAFVGDGLVMPKPIQLEVERLSALFLALKEKFPCP